MISLPRYIFTTIVALSPLLTAPAVQANTFTISYTGLVTATNGCTYPSTTDCYAPVGTSISGSFTYSTGVADLATSTQSFYKNLMTDYSLSIPGSSYSGSYNNVAGFGRFSTARNASTQAASTSSTFSAYVAKDAGNYTFVPGTNTVDFTPRLATSAAVASDNVYGDLMVSEIRVNFAALSGLFANLAVPTTFSFADLDPATSNFAIGFISDPYIFGNVAAFGIGGQLKSVTVSPRIASVPVPAAAWLFGSGLLGLIGVGRQWLALR